MREIVRDAFLAVRGESSPDVVVANPELNAQFIRECQERGLTVPTATLNLTLLNLRKSSDLKGVKSRRVFVPNQEDFRFGSEIAARVLERRYHVSVDQIICDPERAREFDALSAGIAPGFSSFQYRWAALSLRKAKRLRPELLGKVIAAEAVVTQRVEEVKVNELPTRAGLYLFIEPNQVLYVGECRNLQKRVGKHLDHSDNKGLAHWLWQNGVTTLHLEYHVLPVGVSTRVRKAMEIELIRSRNPLYNVAGVE
jgi:hypothetical protein